MFTVLIPNLGSTLPVTTETYKEARALAKSQSGQIVWPNGMADTELFAEVSDCGCFAGSYDEWADLDDVARDLVVSEAAELMAMAGNCCDDVDNCCEEDCPCDDDCPCDEDDCCADTDLETP